MINKKPKTYNELIRMKKCYTLAKYYSNITESLFNEIYDFLGANPGNTILANQEILSLVDNLGKVVKTYPLTIRANLYDRVEITASGIRAVPHYIPGSDYSSSSSSSNNNNNNINSNIKSKK